MSRYHSDDEIRRYDLMKLGVLLLLLVLLALSWFVTSDNLETEVAGGEISASPPSEGANEAGYPAPTSESESAVPTPMGAPVINAPGEALPAGTVTLTGTAEPGTQILVLVDGQPAAAAIAGVDGAWSATTELPPGIYSVQAQAVNNVGVVVSQSEPVEITVVDPTASDAITSIGSPEFDSVSGLYLFSGTADPGETITITSNGLPVGTTLADEAGNWALAVPVDSITGDLQLQTTDATGNVTFTSEPVKPGPRPPSLTSPGEILADPDGGAPSVPVQSGSFTWTGTGEPGTQVEMLINGASAGVAPVGEDGTWSMTVDLPDGTYTAQINALDPSGDLLSSSQPFTVIAGEAVATTGEVTPTTGETTSTAGEGTPASGEATPATGEATPTTGQATPATGEATPTTGEGTPATGEATPTTGQATPTTGEATPTTGEATPTPPPPPISTAAPGQTVGDVLAANPQFSTLVAAAEMVGLQATLSGRTTYTIFAPTNEAFAALPEQVVDALLASPEALSQLLQYHLTFGEYTTADLVVVQPSTVNGRLLAITPQGETLLVNDATIIVPNIVAENGVIHAIDRVLVPPLAEGVRPPIIDDSGVPVFTGTQLTIVGTAEPNSTILVELNGEPFGQMVTVSLEGNWSVAGPVTPGDYQIVAYMLGADGILEAVSRPVTLRVQ